MRSSLASFFIGGVLLAQGAGAGPAPEAINALGVDLYQELAKEEGNLCLSPYSISMALAITLAGADGETRTEMARVLHVSGISDADAAFSALRKSFAESVAKTVKNPPSSQKTDDATAPITLLVANRLFLQESVALQPTFLKQVAEYPNALPEPLDFRSDGAGATNRINQCVAHETRARIRDLIPLPLNGARLVLVNALYLKARWASEFSVAQIKPEPFQVRGKAVADVTTMQKTSSFGYAKKDGYRVVGLPYSGGDLQFVVLLPDAVDGLAGLEKRLTPNVLKHVRS
ncbi:MAG: serpin family protein [Chthoniobacterales bacterium]